MRMYYTYLFEMINIQRRILLIYKQVKLNEEKKTFLFNLFNLRWLRLKYACKSIIVNMPLVFQVGHYAGSTIHQSIINAHHTKCMHTHYNAEEWCICYGYTNKYSKLPWYAVNLRIELKNITYFLLFSTIFPFRMFDRTFYLNCFNAYILLYSIWIILHEWNIW